MKQGLLGALALIQIVIGTMLLLGYDMFATITFDTQPASQWSGVDKANIYYGPVPPPASVSVGAITVNRESH